LNIKYIESFSTTQSYNVAATHYKHVKGHDPYNGNVIEMCVLLGYFVSIITINVGNDKNWTYCIAGKFGRKFGKFGESSLICQTKIIQISTYYIYSLLAEFIIHQTFCQVLKTSKFTQLLPRQTFPLYSILKKAEGNSENTNSMITESSDPQGH